MHIFLVNQDKPSARSLMLKLADQAKPGAIIPVTNEEMALYQSVHFQVLAMGNSDQKIIELDTKAPYIFLLDPKKDNIDEAYSAIEILGLDEAVIRSFT